MTKADFDIIRNSITMRQVAEFYGLHIDSKGFIKCPFHGGGNERTPSLQIYNGYRGFYCRGCNTGGDVTKFVSLYENLEPKDAVKVLAERFGIVTSDNGTIPPEAIERSKQAQFEREREKLHQQQIQAELRQLGTLIYGYTHILDSMVLGSDEWCFVQNELPVLKGKWEYYFSQLRK
jgi:DNA primase